MARIEADETLRNIKAIFRLLVVVATMVGVVSAGPAAASFAVDRLAPATSGDHATLDAVDAPATTAHGNECEHHGCDDDCAFCPACSAIPATDPVTPIIHPAAVTFQYAANLEQSVPRSELPPPKGV